MFLLQFKIYFGFLAIIRQKYKQFYIDLQYSNLRKLCVEYLNIVHSARSANFAGGSPLTGWQPSTPVLPRFKGEL